MQGFVDAHVHVIPAGLSLSRVDLRGMRSRAAFQQQVEALAARLGPGEWVLGGQWDEGEWGGEPPNVEWLDQVRPMSVRRSVRRSDCMPNEFGCVYSLVFVTLKARCCSSSNYSGPKTESECNRALKLEYSGLTETTQTRQPE